MLAGAICDGNECGGLVLVLLAIVAAAVLAATTVAVTWAFVVAAVLRRRGWSVWTRRTAGVAIVVAGGRILTSVAGAVPDLQRPILWLVVLPPMPLLIWLRYLRRVDQSSPCSRA
jgi:hypothetical protein